MLPGLRIGHVGRLSWTVAAQHTIHLGEHELAAGRPGAVVFSTPNMILLMERAAKAALRPFLEPGEESVGVIVNIQHLAATPIAAAVRAEAIVTAITDRAIDFDITAFDSLEPIGKGTHRRAVVAVSKIRQKLADKAAKLPQGILMPMDIQPNTGDLPPLSTLDLQLSKSHTGLATLTFNRPRQLNAVNAAMTEEFTQLVRWFAGHPEVRVVIVTGAGSAFCAGDDVKEVATLDPAAAEALSYQQARMYLALEQLPQVFIAAVNGPALGGGCVAAYSCDLRIAASSATFAMPEILLGWTPGYGLAQLTNLIGKARALELCLTGQTITAQQAYDFGLVSRVVNSSQLTRTATDLAAKLLATPAAALRQTKQVIHLDEGMQPKLTYVSDTAAYIRCLQTDDAKEALAAFTDKRKPKFKGK